MVLKDNVLGVNLSCSSAVVWGTSGTVSPWAIWQRFSVLLSPSSLSLGSLELGRFVRGSRCWLCSHQPEHFPLFHWVCGFRSWVGIGCLPALHSNELHTAVNSFLVQSSSKEKPQQCSQAAWGKKQFTHTSESCLGLQGHFIVCWTPLCLWLVYSDICDKSQVECSASAFKE